jgi:hypothetical protein
MHVKINFNFFLLRRYIFYIGGWINNVSQSSLFFLDLLTKLRWILQTGKMNPPGLSGQVLSNYVLEESILHTITILKKQPIFSIKRNISFLLAALSYFPFAIFFTNRLTISHVAY